MLFGISAAGPPARQDIVLADFEGKDYGTWQTTGIAFGPGPAQGTLPGQMPVSGYRGQGLVNSYFGGDTATGTLTSPEFVLNRKFLNFLIGGGRHDGQTCINLLVGGKIVRTATGPNGAPGGTERLDWATWDVTALQGRTAHLEIVDKATEGWGHISVDEITSSDARQAEEIKTGPLYGETYRPQFHFTARAGWLNDPNGMVYYGGEYHLFFQHNPFGLTSGNLTWGHAVSRDMVHWTQIENAITPDERGPIWSGSAVVDWNNTTGLATGTEKPLIALYTAAGDTSPESKGQPFTQRLVYSLDKGRTWTKYANNPVLNQLRGGNRDPKVVWHEPTKHWIMALYLDKEDFGLFTSPDLKTWKQIQTLTVPGSSECPDFFPMPVQGEPNLHKWVFTGANGHYLIGTFDGTKFTPEAGRSGRLRRELLRGANVQRHSRARWTPDSNCVDEWRHVSADAVQSADEFPVRIDAASNDGGIAPVPLARERDCRAAYKAAHLARPHAETGRQSASRAVRRTVGHRGRI